MSAIDFDTRRLARAARRASTGGSSTTAAS
jgi:hypothetical protein